ncbi:glycerate kinase [Staphylococcus intermedius]|uniref:Glycerate kinase n=1 Tax=Staphylococcus intermedius NCTC 11048 TaxID=1141106 RepID=A0A380G5V3_STAIN|nr:glycerate kinase [Staphylococcus intermedius]PCF78586.1 glycerate kinase [Staphylococcus intermedius]PCF86706.1 glycerate kinase [Staphylococcus intermedius]PCF89783.1 glycerate kinase [Staphylococcus intermedius]PNZ54635.1 glycerate kinase [Staphylococcus intermedius NCTC 11048]SUM45836.1 glycerate kinase [Staphylococcus intermedius NCTC 11048]
MHILIAPDSFKESMTAMQAAEAIEQGWRDVAGDTTTFHKIPMADGGEGTTQSLHDALSGEWRTITVQDPLGRTISATYSLANEGQTAIIEMAAASGLDLVKPEERNPLVTSTYGTGQMLRDALDQGVSHIILGIGGSATNDGGAGLLQAIGVQLLDANGQSISRGGQGLAQLTHIDLSQLDPRLSHVQLEVACDVDNPLLGPNGATTVYSQQKGATEQDQVILEDALTQFHTVIVRDLRRQVANIPGAGAAGGLGAGLLACLPVELKRGIDIVLSVTHFDHHVQQADLVITGEGAIDGQTVYGKTPVGVAKAAKRYGKPVIAIAGKLGAGYEAVEKHGIDAVYSMSTGPMSLEQAINHGPMYLKQWAYHMAKFYQLIKEKR